LTFEQFLHVVYKINPDTIKNNQGGWETVAQSNTVVETLTTFRNISDNEVNKYPPFVDFANAVLDGLGHTDIRFCRNDPTHISGSHGKRKLDVVVVPTTCFNDERTVELCNEGPHPPFWWHHIMASNKFEQIKSEVSTPISGNSFSDLLLNWGSSTFREFQ
jgi:hypothetical protein